eukprot:m.386065 g.386065  ORF g.386065 m.386065 type:complete len:55 (-) comp143285_c0_seq1:33-197(-)
MNATIIHQAAVPKSCASIARVVTATCSSQASSSARWHVPSSNNTRFVLSVLVLF